MSDTIIRQRSFWTKPEEFKHQLDKVDEDLFGTNVNDISQPKTTENPFTEQKSASSQSSPSMPAKKKRPKDYIKELEESPESLGDIATLEQLLAVLGHWAENILRSNQRYRKSFFRLLKVLEYHYKKFESHFPHFFDSILLRSCEEKANSNEQSTKRNKRNSQAIDAKTEAITRSVQCLTRLFAEERTVQHFLSRCFHATNTLLPQTLEILSKKHWRVSREILTNPNLINKTEPGLAKQLYAHDPALFAKFFRGIIHQKEFLITHRDWITGAHLIEVLPYLSKTLKPKELDSYLKGKKDKQKNTPLNKLREFIVENIANSNSLFHQKIAYILENHAIRGAVNLSGEEMIAWAKSTDYHPKVCQALAQGRDFYQKTRSSLQSLEPLARPFLKNGMVYLHASINLQKKIENTKTWFFGGEDDRIEKCLKDWINQKNIDPVEAAIVARNPRYLRHIMPAPESSGCFFGLIGKRTQEKVAEETKILAKKSPFLAAAFYKRHTETFDESLIKVLQWNWWDVKQLVDLVIYVFKHYEDNSFRQAIQEGLVKRFCSEGKYSKLYHEFCSTCENNLFICYGENLQWVQSIKESFVSQVTAQESKTEANTLIIDSKEVKEMKSTRTNNEFNNTSANAGHSTKHKSQCPRTQNKYTLNHQKAKKTWSSGYGFLGLEWKANATCKSTQTITFQQQPEQKSNSAPVNKTFEIDLSSGLTPRSNPADTKSAPVENHTATKEIKNVPLKELTEEEKRYLQFVKLCGLLDIDPKFATWENLVSDFIQLVEENHHLCGHANQSKKIALISQRINELSSDGKNEPRPSVRLKNQQINVAWQEGANERRLFNLSNKQLVLYKAPKLSKNNRDTAAFNYGFCCAWFGLDNWFAAQASVKKSYLKTLAKFHPDKEERPKTLEEVKQFESIKVKVLAQFRFSNNTMQCLTKIMGTIGPAPYEIKEAVFKKLGRLHQYTEEYFRKKYCGHPTQRMLASMADGFSAGLEERELIQDYLEVCSRKTKQVQLDEKLKADNQKLEEENIKLLNELEAKLAEQEQLREQQRQKDLAEFKQLQEQQRQKDLAEREQQRQKDLAEIKQLQMKFAEHEQQQQQKMFALFQSLLNQTGTHMPSMSTLLPTNVNTTPYSQGPQTVSPSTIIVSSDGVARSATVEHKDIPPNTTITPQSVESVDVYTNVTRSNNAAVSAMHSGNPSGIFGNSLSLATTTTQQNTASNPLLSTTVALNNETNASQQIAVAKIS